MNLLFFELADEDQQSVVGGANSVSAFVTGVAPEYRGNVGIGQYSKTEPYVEYDQDFNPIPTGYTVFQNIRSGLIAGAKTQGFKYDGSFG